MHIVAIASQKGGAGKTTLALNLAVAAEQNGHVAAVIDLDPQASATGWKDSRTQETPAVVAVPAARLEQAIAICRESGADIVFFDTAPHSSNDALTAAEAADLILIPCRPGILDLRAITSTAKIARIACKPAYVILNAVPPQATSLIEDAKAAVLKTGLEVSPVTIQQRAAYAHAITAGQTAQEYEPVGKAADEMEKLYAWLQALLNQQHEKLALQIA